MVAVAVTVGVFALLDLLGCIVVLIDNLLPGTTELYGVDDRQLDVVLTRSGVKGDEFVLRGHWVFLYLMHHV